MPVKGYAMTNELTDLTNIPAPTLTLDPVSDGEVAEVSILSLIHI